jgi:hypothetical protein
MRPSESRRAAVLHHSTCTLRHRLAGRRDERGLRAIRGVVQTLKAAMREIHGMRMTLTPSSGCVRNSKTRLELSADVGPPLAWSLDTRAAAAFHATSIPTAGSAVSTGVAWELHRCRFQTKTLPSIGFAGFALHICHVSFSSERVHMEVCNWCVLSISGLESGWVAKSPRARRADRQRPTAAVQPGLRLPGFHPTVAHSPTREVASTRTAWLPAGGEMGVVPRLASSANVALRPPTTEI